MIEYGHLGVRWEHLSRRAGRRAIWRASRSDYHAFYSPRTFLTSSLYMPALLPPLNPNLSLERLFTSFVNYVVPYRRV